MPRDQISVTQARLKESIADFGPQPALDFEQLWEYDARVCSAVAKLHYPHNGQ